MFLGPLHARQDEVASMVVLEVDRAAPQASGEQHAVGVFHEVGESRRVLLRRSLHHRVLGVFGLSDPPFARTPDEVPSPDHASVVVLEPLGRVDAADLVDASRVARPIIRLRDAESDLPGVGLGVPRCRSLGQPQFGAAAASLSLLATCPEDNKRGIFDKKITDKKIVKLFTNSDSPHSVVIFLSVIFLSKSEWPRQVLGAG